MGFGLNTEDNSCTHFLSFPHSPSSLLFQFISQVFSLRHSSTCLIKFVSIVSPQHFTCCLCVSDALLFALTLTAVVRNPTLSIFFPTPRGFLRPLLILSFDLGRLLPA
jgi:hypothetical protein